ncbi:hypothetical protein V8E54_007305 [Elaphomyces granulatus]
MQEGKHGLKSTARTFEASKILAQQRREELRIEALVQGHEDALLEIVGNDQGEEGDEREEEVEEQTDQTFYWDSSANETDTESEPDVESELNNETESLPTNEQSRSASGTFGELPLRWNQDAGKNLRGAYGSGSRSTHKRERRKAKALECEAKKSCNIVAVFGRQRELNLSLSPTVQDNSMPTTLPMQSAPLSMVPRGGPALQPVSKKEELRAALEDLKHLLRHVSDQEKKYGERLNINGNFYLRHTMVRQFLELQLAEHTEGTRRDRALSVAQGAGKGYAFGRRIVQWEISWVQDRVIPRRGQGGGRGSWMNDDDIAQSVRYFARQEGDSK